MASDGVEVASTPEEPQSVSRPVSCGKEPVSELRKKSPEARSAAGKKYRKRRLSPKPKSFKSKRKRSNRLKFVYSNSPSSDTSETSAGKGPRFFPGTNARPGIRQWSESPQNRGWQTAKTQFRGFAPGTKRRYQQS